MERLHGFSQRDWNAERGPVHRVQHPDAAMELQTLDVEGLCSHSAGLGQPCLFPETDRCVTNRLSDLRGDRTYLHHLAVCRPTDHDYWSDFVLGWVIGEGNSGESDNTWLAYGPLGSSPALGLERSASEACGPLIGFVLDVASTSVVPRHDSCLSLS